MQFFRAYRDLYISQRQDLTHTTCPPPAFPLSNIGLRLGAPSSAKIRHHESRASLLGGQPFNSSHQPFASSYHESEGYRPIGRRAAAKGASEMYKPNSLWTWSFLGVTFLQSAIILGFEAYVNLLFRGHFIYQFEYAYANNYPRRYVFALFEQSLRVDATQDVNTRTYTRTIPTFLTLYIFGSFYQLVLVWDALRLKNTIQVIGLCLYNVALLIYASVQGDQIKTATDVIASRQLSNNPAIWSEMRPYLIVIPCVLALGTVLMSFVAWKLYEEFAWTIYKQISADLRMKRRYLTFQVRGVFRPNSSQFIELTGIPQIYIALLKFDFFLFLGFTIQFLVIVVDRTDVEFGLTIAAVPITILILVMAAYWTRKENKLGMSAIIVLLPTTIHITSTQQLTKSSSCILRLLLTSYSSWHGSTLLPRHRLTLQSKSR